MQGCPQGTCLGLADIGGEAIVEGLRFDYLLVDSWFPCAELLQFIHSRHFKCNLLGMIKMGKTEGETALGNLCAPDIIKRLEKPGPPGGTVPLAIPAPLSGPSMPA